ncbi:MAG: glycosyl transferase family 1 [Chloroflexi bacterium B3_Chlor]|nr:MAG: glycosyl transferase family 1 [Chloroflexi bacterium B3_Chlor]
MRLGINGFFWNRESTGSGQYTRNLVDGLLTLPEGPACVLFRPGRTERSRNVLASGRRMQEVYLAPPISLTENLSKLWFEQVSFPRACTDQEVDVAHVPYFASPLRTRSRIVVTIHDLIPLILPAYRGSIPVRLYARLVAAGAKRATAIVTDSVSSKQDILDLLNVSPARVHVVHLAVSEMFKPVRDAQRLRMIRQKYHLSGEYALYLGGVDQRKNLETLLLAFATLAKHSSTEAQLVIAGRLPVQDSAFFPDPRPVVERLGLRDKVIFVGWVPEEDKPALYSDAALFVFPSLYEGFGLPPLEAMSCGTPLVVSNCSSLPEIVGEAAVLVDAHDADGLAGAMAELLEDENRRRELAAKGLKRAQLFSWQKTAKQTMEVYELVAAGK